MAALPKLAKLRTKTRLPEADYRAILEITAQTHLSTSECIENMVLMVKGIYEQDETEAVVYILRKLKYETLVNAESLREIPPLHSCHVTLHPAVLDFAEFLRSTYPPVFKTPNEAIALCARYCCRFWENLNHRRYLCSRLLEIGKQRRGGTSD